MEQRRIQNAGRRIAALGILTGLSLAAFLLESLIPMPFLPGAKLGLANIFSLIAMLLWGLPEALAVVVVRTFLGSLFAGNISMLMYSATAGIASTAATRLMILALPHVSFLAVSVAGAVIHNLVQLSVYCGLTGTVLLFAYAPYLCLMGAAAGAAVGLVVIWTIKALPARFFAESAASAAQIDDTQSSKEESK